MAIEGVLKRCKRSVNEYDFVGEPTTLDGVWIGFGKFSIKIHKTDEGVVVDIWGKGQEDGDCLASTYAFDDEAEDE